MLRRSLLAALSTFALAPAAQAGFRPPGKAARRAAIGPLDDLEPALRRAFTLTDDDAPMPAPGPDDWLSSHPEPGQSFAEFVRAWPNRLGHSRNKIVLQPIGELADGGPPLRTLIDFAERYFGLPAIARPALTCTKSTTWSRSSWGTQRSFRAPQQIFLCGRAPRSPRR